MFNVRIELLTVTFMLLTVGIGVVTVTFMLLTVGIEVLTVVYSERPRCYSKRDHPYIKYVFNRIS